MEIEASAGRSDKRTRPCLARRTREQAPPASDATHVAVLRTGARAWNAWRRENPGIVPALDGLALSVTERQFGRVQGGPINLSRAQLCRARLDQATLIEGNLMGAVLTEADLSDARLEKADLRGARFDYANLAGARLDGADLCGAHLRLARGLTQAQVDRSLGDRRTELPAHLAVPGAWLDGGSRHRPVKTPQRPARPYQASRPSRGSHIVFTGVVMAAIAAGALIALTESRLERFGPPASDAAPMSDTGAQDAGIQAAPEAPQSSSG
jgi:hypothetical protein